jgi:molybdopterin-containing oxidoreductase family iron-sulfur binding subunit
MKPATWAQVDEIAAGALKPESKIAILSHTMLSPTEKQVIKEFQAKFPNTKVVIYDPVSSAALIKANELMYGVAMVPGYQFDKAKVIVSVQADFLGTWISPAQFAINMQPIEKSMPAAPKMSRHIQVESYMSLSGTNADNRIRIKPSETGAAIARLYNKSLPLKALPLSMLQIFLHH